jgi:uncharacterized protein YbaR (Trm112 family)
MGQCPECGSHYPPAVVACPQCRVVLEPVRTQDGDAAEVVHRVPDAVAGALLCGILEHHGLPAVLRAATLPGYGTVRRDWSTSAWGEILVARSYAAEARSIIADYLQALAEGGAVRDDDVEASEP